jgi:hypothetical protein
MGAVGSSFVFNVRVCPSIVSVHMFEDGNAFNEEASCDLHPNQMCTDHLTIGSTCTLLVVTFQLELNSPLEAQVVSASILNKS